MTTDNDLNDTELETGETPARSGGVAMSLTDGMDTTMAAGPRSGAAGVANAELGTSGPPAEDILSPEEMAALEIPSGGGSAHERLSKAQLDEYFSDEPDVGRSLQR